jgi:hypothetical protein
MWDFIEELTPWIRIPLALGLIGMACAVLQWAPGEFARLWYVPLAAGVVILILGGWGD